MDQQTVRKQLAKAKRIVVKIGTSSITDENHRLDPEKIGRLVSNVMGLRSRGKEVILVSSGAIGAGIGRLNLDGRPKDIPALQATAAVGQGMLMQVYSKYFGEYQQPVAQILLTAEDFSNPRRYRNFRNMLATLMKWGVVPVVNENDSVASDEIRLGDNDILSAYVSIGASADLLVILTDVDGLYMGYSKRGNRGKLIKTVDGSLNVERYVDKASRGFGGMLTKIKAARMVTEKGIPVVIASSSEEKVLERILDGEEIGTLFLPVRLR
ncbi:MAG: glutamate 5-kinase [Candidatus Hadarchaeum sp.]|uniref:glutamate 5-kinase n=1 Tax=Candidatus Hadarchaeum sp. TaxID=2883567 RepID=UPI00317457A3